MSKPMKKEIVTCVFLCPYCGYEHAREEAIDKHMVSCAKNPTNVAACVICKDSCHGCYHYSHTSYQKSCDVCSHNYVCKFDRG